MLRKSDRQSECDLLDVQFTDPSRTLLANLVGKQLVRPLVQGDTIHLPQIPNYARSSTISIWDILAMLAEPDKHYGTLHKGEMYVRRQDELPANDKVLDDSRAARVLDWPSQRVIAGMNAEDIVAMPGLGYWRVSSVGDVMVFDGAGHRLGGMSLGDAEAVVAAHNAVVEAVIALIGDDNSSAARLKAAVAMVRLSQRSAKAT